MPKKYLPVEKLRKAAPGESLYASKARSLGSDFANFHPPVPLNAKGITESYATQSQLDSNRVSGVKDMVLSYPKAAKWPAEPNLNSKETSIYSDFPRFPNKVPSKVPPNFNTPIKAFSATLR